MKRSAAAITAPGTDRHLAGLERREEVHAGDEICPVDDTCVHERAGAAGGHLLGVLKDETNLAGELVAALDERSAQPRAASRCARRGRRRASRRAGSRHMATSFSSRIGSASMSARSATILPGAGTVQPRDDAGAVSAARSRDLRTSGAFARRMPPSRAPRRRARGSRGGAAARRSRGPRDRRRREPAPGSLRRTSERKLPGPVRTTPRWVPVLAHVRGRHDGEDRLALQASRASSFRRPRSTAGSGRRTTTATTACCSRTTSSSAGCRRWCRSATTSSHSTRRSSCTPRSGRRRATSAGSRIRSSTAGSARSASAPTTSRTRSAASARASTPARRPTAT